MAFTTLNTEGSYSICVQVMFHQATVFSRDCDRAFRATCVRAPSRFSIVLYFIDVIQSAMVSTIHSTHLIHCCISRRSRPMRPLRQSGRIQHRRFHLKSTSNPVLRNANRVTKALGLTMCSLRTGHELRCQIGLTPSGSSDGSTT
jgi:hypothetical protein